MQVSPTMRQSAVGLMLLVSGAALIGFIAWLADFTFGGRSYRATILFPNVGSMVVGTAVGYRGVTVGRVTGITPEPEGVAVEVRISPANQIIPSNSVIEAVQSGLVGETRIDITPLQSLPTGDLKGTPLSTDCDSAIIICNDSRLQGQAALDVNSLIRSLLRISNLITDPELVAAFRSLTQRTSTTLGRINQVSGEATVVLKDVQRSGTIQELNTGMRSLRGLDQVSGNISELSGELQGVGPLSREAKVLIRDLQSNDRLKNLDSTLVEARKTLVSVGETADQIRLFLASNQNRIVGTLDSIQKTSDSLQTTITRLDPVLTQVEQSQLIGNLEEISANTAILTKNLKDFSAYLSDPEAVVMIQKLLDSARVAFENLQKLTSDLDEITGNPQLRQDLIRLIQGLTNLVSSTQQLQQDALYGKTLTQVAAEIATLAPIRQPTKSLPESSPLPAKKP